VLYFLLDLHPVHIVTVTFYISQLLDLIAAQHGIMKNKHT